jgi:hypothetical protein
MPELVRLETPELLMAISDILLNSPFVDGMSERSLLVREVREARIRKQVGAITISANLILHEGQKEFPRQAEEMGASLSKRAQT